MLDRLDALQVEQIQRVLLAPSPPPPLPVLPSTGDAVPTPMDTDGSPAAHAVDARKRQFDGADELSASDEALDVRLRGSEEYADSPKKLVSRDR